MKKYVYIGAVVAILGLIVAGITQIKSCKHEQVLGEAEKKKQTAILNPSKIKKEIEDDQNISLGIIIGSVIIGISIIIASVISSPSNTIPKKKCGGDKPIQELYKGKQ